MREEMGADNFFLFGMTVNQVEDLARQGLVQRSTTRRVSEVTGLSVLWTGLFVPLVPWTIRIFVPSLYFLYHFFIPYPSTINCTVCQYRYRRYATCACMAKSVIFNVAAATILDFAGCQSCRYKASYGTLFSVSVSNLVLVRSKMAELWPFNC